MADLKLGTTVGGSVAWHQGNFPLSPVSNDVYYKTYKLYSEWNKPQAIDNDFVSKALGGEYLKNVNFKEGLTFPDANAYPINLALNSNTATTAMYTAKMQIKDIFAIETSEGQPFILFNPDKAMVDPRLTVMGPFSAQEVYEGKIRVFSPNNPPTPTDVSLGNVVNALQVQLLLTTKQTMSGILEAPNFVSQNPGSQADHVVRYDQTVLRDAAQDFGYYS